MNCLDSSFIVDFLDSEREHHEAAVEWMDASEGSYATPSICAFEVLHGTARAGEKRFEHATGFLRTLSVLDLTLEGAIAAGEFDGRRHAAGNPLGPRDTLVASAARQNGATLITADGDFEGVPDLDVTRYRSR